MRATQYKLRRVYKKPNYLSKLSEVNESVFTQTVGKEMHKSIGLLAGANDRKARLGHI